jgi:MarR family transcriptional regulator for hemolysin
MRDPQYLGRWLAFAHKAMRAEFEARLAAEGGSLSTWIVLRNAHRDPPLSQRELAGALGVEGPTLVRHLDRMAAEGLVERRRDATDRRVARVVVTPAGAALLERLHAVAAGTEADVRELLGVEVHESVRDALQVLHAHFSELAEKRRADAGR